MEEREAILSAKLRLIEAGGRASQDLGTGRITGQILVYLYLQENECSLDDIAEDLGLSKASISIAVRKLEQLGLVRNIWRSGDKRKYYRSAENIAKALQQGILLLLHQKIQIFGDELDESLKMISSVSSDADRNNDFIFLQQRIARAKKLQSGLEKILGNPLLKLLAKMNS
jgi:DNA-binding transcriptional regulator GbsR (MarR family)